MYVVCRNGLILEKGTRYMTKKARSLFRFDYTEFLAVPVATGVWSFCSCLHQKRFYLVDAYIKFIYSEKATQFYEISTVDLTLTTKDKKLWPFQNIGINF